ncbi:MAG: UDP-N-acetylmuramoyl-tripeptide--D-alanyl-D-alanine ligase [Bacteroidales bacterium]|nr:UDP-N-acetylmuramoyl-tripeptide--D-alanyl-D-alanine ligase [Bacteroidales bacterium]
MDIKELYKIYKDHPEVTIDSRICPAGGLFFALRGTRTNGNLYAEDALRKGCSYAIVDDPKAVRGSGYILVKDTLKALQGIAKEHREHLDIPVIAITGSNGKTTTKELILQILSHAFLVSGTYGNLNNHIGLPLTLLKTPKKAEVLVLEMGANHPGEIAELCKIARPTYGIITNIGKAHLEGFLSIEQIIETKTALYDYLRQNEGTIFFHWNNPVLKDNLLLSDHRVSYGTDERSDYFFTDAIMDPYLSFLWKKSSGDKRVRTQLYGMYNLENVMAAITVAAYFGVEDNMILKAVYDYVAGNMRSQIVHTDKNIVILDAYNANPTSMKFAVEEFANQPNEKKALILGDMAELGEQALEEHEHILQLIRHKGFVPENVFLTGKIFSSLSGEYGYKGFVTTPDLISYLRKNSLKNYMILVKGSRIMKMEEVLTFI